MNPGFYGFPPGSNVVIDTQEFDVSGIWYKPKNAVFCIINGTGGGQAGDFGSTTGNQRGGAAGLAYQVVIHASRLNPSEIVTIGAGGRTSNLAVGGQSTFAGFVWPGGKNDGNRNATAYAGGNLGLFTGLIHFFGGAGIGSFERTIINGAVGGFGAGGGGGPGWSGAGGFTGTDGGDGGIPCSFAFGIGTVAAARGGGPKGGAAGISGGATAGAGENAQARHDRFGFGAGGGGGGGGGPSNGGLGGRGRRGGGGGCSGMGRGGGNAAAQGGDGYIRITTYCWE